VCILLVNLIAIQELQDYDKQMKQIGFKPKKMRLVKPIKKYHSISISNSVHEILSCEKARFESFDKCISRIIKERAALRIEISRMQ
jgi:hypothetical protein